ncbi:MAG: hypothetical protein JSS87_01380 [Acidobacteria bacterium]|nr:hypothetical protein [Acidobacteriota bacterium]
MSEQKTPGAGGAYGGQNEGAEARSSRPVTSPVPERKDSEINPSSPNNITTTSRDGAERSIERADER